MAGLSTEENKAEVYQPRLKQQSRVSTRVMQLGMYYRN